MSIHTAIYQATDAQAVIHVHSPFATAVASRTPTPELWCCYGWSTTNC